MVKKLKAGNGMDKTTHLGPCISKVQQERVLEYIRLGKAEGAVIAAQGSLPSDPACKDGYFVPPTFFKDVSRYMRIAKEEIFGPVVTLTKFESEEAILIANDTPYGLTPGIYTRNSERILRVARNVDAGMIWINNYLRSAIGVPFGGMKDSGYGREHCIESYEYMTVKTIRIPSGLGTIPKWRTWLELDEK